MKRRLCLFAGYDCKNEIDDYVVYLIEQLSKISDVYYYGDFECQKEELNKLSKFCKGIYAKRHKKYDFGSWQELITIIGQDKIREYDELILTNDSCFGPLYPITNVFDEMNLKQCDFWGLSASRGYHIHIQSYFIVFRKKIIDSEELFEFLETVKPEKSLKEVCKNYEDRLTYYLSKKGYTFKTYIPYGDFKNQPYYNTTNAISKAKFPLLKVKTFYGEVGHERIKNWKKLIKENSKYDIKLIENNLKKRGLTEDDIYNYLYAFKKTRKLVILKRILYKIIKFMLYPFIKFLHMFIDRKIEQITNIYNYKFNVLDKQIYDLKNELIKLNTKEEKKELISKQMKETRKEQIKVIDSKKNSDEKILSHKDCFRLKDIQNLFSSFDENGKDILFIGNTSLANCLEFSGNNNRIFVANNDLVEENTKEIEKICINDLKDFVIEKNSERILFDMIFLQAFDKNVNLKIKTHVINNLLENMVYEGTLIINILNDELEDYKEFFEKKDIIFDKDAYALYLDKIQNNGKYQTMFIRKK